MAFIAASEMYTGETAEIISIDGSSGEFSRLKSMGIREGRLVDLLYYDPSLTKKVVLGVDRSRIAFDAQLAPHIKVRPLKGYLETMRTQAHYDKLTGCLNRYATDTFLQEELEKFSSRDIPLCTLMADIDHFKRINDSYGHVVGDTVLSTFASVVKQTLRRSDVLCRWGGEEFLILLRGTVAAEALYIAERIRKAVEAHHFPPLAAPGLLTVSIGGAGLPPRKEVHRLISDTDKALYQAKNGGRNRVRIC